MKNIEEERIKAKIECFKQTKLPIKKVIQDALIKFNLVYHGSENVPLDVIHLIENDLLQDYNEELKKFQKDDSQLKLDI